MKLPLHSRKSTASLLALSVMAGGQLFTGADKTVFALLLLDLMRSLGERLDFVWSVATVHGFSLALGALVSGWLIPIRGPRSALVTGIILHGSAIVLITFSNSLPLLVFNRLLAGFGEGLWKVACLGSAGALMPQRRGILITILTTIYSIGFAVGAPFAAFTLRYGWRVPLYALGLVDVGLGIATFRFLRGLNLSAVKASKAAGSYWSILKARNVALICIVSSFWIFSNSALVLWLPTYMRAILLFSSTEAGLLAGLRQTFVLLPAFPLAYASDKYGRRPILILSAAGTAVATFVIFNIVEPQNFSQAAMAAIASGIFDAVPFTILTAFVQESVPADKVATATGFLTMTIFTLTGLSGIIHSSLIGSVGWRITSYTLVAGTAPWILVTALAKETVIEKKRRSEGLDK